MSALPIRGQRWMKACGIALLLTGGVWTGAIWWRARHPAETSSIAALVHASAGRRLVEGRLSGGFGWAPFQATRGIGGVSGSDASWELAGVAAGIQERNVHTLAIANLLLGNVDAAISHLEIAAEDSPSADVLSDLAAALIERGRGAGHAQDLVRALDHAEEALARDPGLVEARFNKALAMQELGLRESAARWWESYGTADHGSPWAAEARARQERLREGPRSPSWAELAGAFGRACASKDKTEAERIVRERPQEAAEAIMSDLGRWTQLVLAKDGEAAALGDRLAVASRALAAVTGDRLLESAVREIDAASGAPARRLQLARAYRELQVGRSQLDDLRAEQAHGELANAHASFRVLQSPMSDVADLYRLSSAYYLTQPETLLVEIDQLIGRAHARESHFVEARAHWLAATTLISAGRKAAALQEATAARDGLDRLGFTADAIFVRSILASTSWLLGRYAQSWEQHRASFRLLDDVPDPRRAQALLGSSAFEAEVEGYRRAALVLQEAAMMFARRHNSTVDRCDATVWLARTAQLAGVHSVAAGALEEARGLARQVTDANLRARYESELDIVQAKLESQASPARSAAILDRALAATKQDDRRLEIHLARAMAREKAGDASGASEDYLAALSMAERQRSTVTDPYLRISLFDTMWQLAREIVRFEIDQRNPERALILANRIRSASVRARHAIADDEVLSVLMRHLGQDQAVVAFAVLEDRTAAWVIREDGVWSTSVGLSSREMRRLVEQARRAVAASAPVPTADPGDEVLFRRLLYPLRAHLTGATEVVLVPDGSLHLVPWGALRDPASGSRWIEDVALAVAPSLSAITAAVPGGPGHASTRAVVVGNPAFDRSVHPELVDLPGAEKEAREIGAMYPASVVLTNRDATPERVMEEAERADVLHIAAHAIPHVTDPELSTIVLAPGGAVDPDGVLTARDILACDMRRLRVVVLAACRSGDGPLSRIEGPLSVARPFLENGAHTVVVSLWDFPDESGSMVVQALHRGIRAGLRPTTALQRASKECWSTPGLDPRACGGLQIILNEPWGRNHAPHTSRRSVGAGGRGLL